MIAVGMPLQELTSLFGIVELAATVENEYSIPEENNLRVYICRHPKMTLQKAWPRLKFYGQDSPWACTRHHRFRYSGCDSCYFALSVSKS